MIPHRRRCERSEAIHCLTSAQALDCFVAALLAMTGKNDSTPPSLRAERSNPLFNLRTSSGLLRRRAPRKDGEDDSTPPSLRAGRSNPLFSQRTSSGLLRRRAPRNDAGKMIPHRRRCERSEAIHSLTNRASSRPRRLALPPSPALGPPHPAPHRGNVPSECPLPIVKWDELTPVAIDQWPPSACCVAS